MHDGDNETKLILSGFGEQNSFILPNKFKKLQLRNKKLIVH